jgi:dipeptidyl aminopeptidase/acylaminoacyl peptidase
MNYYPPNNKDYEFPEGELPALLVRIHGGPTSAASTLFNINYQFWTSRGKWSSTRTAVTNCASGSIHT